MIEIELEQDTPAWHAYRKTRIGASDAPAIMEISPWSTPLDLFYEKKGFVEKKQNQAMERGKILEGFTRATLSDQLGIELMPIVAQHQEFPWMFASLDAIDKTRTIVHEIKHPNIQNHNLAKDGIIPAHYFPQLQHQLEVCLLDWAYYTSCYNDELVTLKIFRDDAYIKNMIEKEYEFWECLNTLTPPKETERDYTQKSDDLWNQVSDEWNKAIEQMKHFENKAQECRATLISMSGGRNCKGNGVKVSRVIRKGNIPYSEIPEIMAMDLEKHRKPPTESWRIIYE